MRILFSVRGEPVEPYEQVNWLRFKLRSLPSTRLRWSFDGQAGVYCWAWRSIRANGFSGRTGLGQ